MSDHWEFFPCQMGENTAFIFYDHGISATIDSFDENQQVRFDLTYKAPADTGLPTNEEFDAVNDLRIASTRSSSPTAASTLAGSLRPGIVTSIRTLAFHP